MRPVNENDTNFYNCHQCTKREKWNENWCWCYEVFGEGYRGYEIERRFCSDECYTNWTNKKKVPIKTKQKIKPVLKFHDDSHGNRLRIAKYKSKNVVKLILADGTKPRHIGIIFKRTKKMVVTRKRAVHLMQNFNAYGFNDYLLRNSQLFDTIELSDEHGKWVIPKAYILENGKHLFFKQQGFELQIFISLESIAQFKN